MSNKDVAVIFHENCNDGFGAAYTAWTKYKENAEYLPMGYRSELNKKAIKGKDVFVLDFSFSPDVLFNTIAPLAKSVTILDHHLSPKNDWLREVPDMEEVDQNVTTYNKGNISVLFDMSKSGAKLTWQHMYPGTNVPAIIEHVSDADLYTFNMKDTKAFDMYMRSLPREFGSWEFEDFRLRNGITSAYDSGRSISQFYNNQVKNLFNSRKVRPIEFEIDTDEGIRVVSGYSINASLVFANELGANLASRKGTFGLIWETDGVDCFCSLRSVNGFDCIPIAKKFRGGGHKQSCGFSLPLIEMYKLLN